MFATDVWYLSSPELRVIAEVGTPYFQTLSPAGVYT